jgi:hypothetical protein
MAAKFPKEGISVEALKVFAETHRLQVSDKQTWWVAENVIKIVGKGRSYVDYIQTESEGSVGTATVFVSHTWESKFDNLVLAISLWCTEKKTKENATFVWIDIFSLNQHETLMRAQLPETYGKFFEKIKSAIILLDDWPNGDMRPFQDTLPNWAKRLWCLLEFAMLKESAIGCSCGSSFFVIYHLCDDIDTLTMTLTSRFVRQLRIYHDTCWPS